MVNNEPVYKNYTLHVSTELVEFGNRICFIKRGGLTVDKAIGLTPEAAIERAKKMIDAWLADSW